MDSSMSCQIRHLGKPFAAYVAHEMLYVNVLLLMRSQVADQRKPLTASTAFKWLFTNVKLSVVF